MVACARACIHASTITAVRARMRAFSFTCAHRPHAQTLGRSHIGLAARRYRHGADQDSPPVEHYDGQTMIDPRLDPH